MIIERQIEALIETDFFKGKVILLLGARLVGKSTLIRKLPICETNKTLWLDGENADVHLLIKNINGELL
jgi:predicted AAA+ superfamily ATPase